MPTDRKIKDTSARIPIELAQQIKNEVISKKLYRTVNEFVIESVRLRLIEIQKESTDRKAVYNY